MEPKSVFLTLLLAVWHVTEHKNLTDEKLKNIFLLNLTPLQKLYFINLLHVYLVHHV